eukprot:scaffold5886_cov161-Amphora_coffeaeformis.AAC.10
MIIVQRMIRLLLQFTVVMLMLLSPLVSSFSQTAPRLWNDMTVSQLRQAIKDGGYNERGLLSRLKRKQDLIEFLQEQNNNEAAWQLTKEEEEEKEDVAGVAASRNSHDNHPTQSLSSSSPIELDLDPKIRDILPQYLQQSLKNKGMTRMLPIQQASFVRIWQGRDTVLQAPTGQGKTLAFALPLIAQEKPVPPPQAGVATPQVIVICPSRELARQVGKEFQRFVPQTNSVATVFGGIPVERHVALLKYKPRYVVATPGRLRELVRLGHLSYQQVTTLVLDEADVLLDAQDSPDIQSILRDMEETIDLERSDNPEYQLVLVSATLNENVRIFTEEMEISPRAYISASATIQEETDAGVPPSNQVSPAVTPQQHSLASTSAPMAVQHWHMSCKSSVRPQITADVIAMLQPRLALIFVPTKSEAESVAADLSTTCQVATIHGDMSQTARSRTIAQILRSSDDSASQVLVATDVISRGLDLPNVDLVIQFGIPRVAGKDGTYNTELYTHRTGRAGRYRVNASAHGQTRTANALLLWDPAVGEGKLLPQLAQEVEKELGRKIVAKSVPSSLDIINTGYKRALASISRHEDIGMNELSIYFRSKLEKDMDTSDTDALLDALASAMASAANLDPSLSPTEPHASLLSGDPALRTIRVSKEGSVLSPREVTAFCKQLGSGKLGRVTSCTDGSAVFDLNTKKAEQLVQAATSDEWYVELPLTLPEMP